MELCSEQKGNRLTTMGMSHEANYLAEHNDVTAIEPDEESVAMRWAGNRSVELIEW